MACEFPPELTEDDLLAILLDEADARDLAHVHNCPHCAARLEELREFSQDFLEQLEDTRAECPAPELLADFLVGLLPPVEHQEILKHIQECEYCRRDENDLRTQFTIDEDKTQMPAKPMKSGRVRPSEFIAEVLAEPHYGETRGAVRGETAADGGKRVRGEASAARGRPHIAMSGEVSVSLLLEHDPDGVKIMGTLYETNLALASHWENAIVEIRRDHKLIAAARVDNMNSFECTLPDDTSVEVRITSADGRSVVVPEVHLR